jgi:hypothetical protein
MPVAFRTQEKQRLNRVMNALGFDYPNFSKPTTNAEAREKRKRSAQVAGKGPLRGKSRKKLVVKS